MPFKKGQVGNPTGAHSTANSGAQHKKWLVKEMVASAQKDPAKFREELEVLRTTDLGKFLDILVKMFPKEQSIDANHSVEFDPAKITEVITRIKDLMDAGK